MAQGAAALQGDFSTDGFRLMLHEHAQMILTQMASQQSTLVHDVNARIDSQIDVHMAALRAEMITMKGDMVAQMTASTQSAISALNSQLSGNISAEVSSLESKFVKMLDNSSSVNSGSHLTTASASSAASAVSDCGPGNVGDRAAESHHQQWRCPICDYPLKHEKSFYDHIVLLQSRVHVLPGAGRRHRQKGKKCLWDVTDDDHQALVAPWARVNLTFWNQASLFCAALIRMLKPGTGVATQHADNPRHAHVIAFIAECRSGVFVPRQGF